MLTEQEGFWSGKGRVSRGEKGRLESEQGKEYTGLWKEC